MRVFVATTHPSPEGNDGATSYQVAGAMSARQDPSDMGRAPTTSQGDLADGLVQVYPISTTRCHVLLAPKLCIGRTPPCEIVITSDLVSRWHAQLERTAKGWRIRDLDSTNGVFVNGVRVGSKVLSSGDLIRIGAALFCLAPGEAACDNPERAAERLEDIPLLVQQVMQRQGRQHPVTVEAMEQLCLGARPDNVRDLEATVLRALDLLAPGERLDLEHLTQRPGRGRLEAATAMLKELEQALRRHAGDVNAAAREIGISRSQLYRRAQKHGLRVSAFRR